MNDPNIVEKTNDSPPRGARGGQYARRFTLDEKLKAVRLYLQEGFSLSIVCKEIGASRSSLEHWVQAYRLGGEAGLEPVLTRRRTPKLPAAITDKIIELKKQNPTFGIKSISQALRRL